MVLIPGVIDNMTKHLEHPEVVAERIQRAVDAVGERERVIAGVDCGFAVFTDNAMLTEDICWAKFRALRAGGRPCQQPALELAAGPVPPLWRVEGPLQSVFVVEAQNPGFLGLDEAALFGSETGSAGEEGRELAPRASSRGEGLRVHAHLCAVENFVLSPARVRTSALSSEG